MKTSIYFRVTLVAVCSVFIAACARIPLQPQEFLLVPFLAEETWEIAHSAEDATQRVQEFVRPGQNVDNWTELVTVQTFNKKVDWGSIDDMLSKQRKNLVSRCPGSTLNVVRREATSLLYESNIINCSEGRDEQSIGKLLDGRNNRFLIIYGIRSPMSMTAAQRKEWIDKLSETSIAAL